MGAGGGLKGRGVGEGWAGGRETALLNGKVTQKKGKFCLILNGFSAAKTTAK